MHNASLLRSQDCPGLGLDRTDRSTAPTEDADLTAETAPVHQPHAPSGSPTHSNIDGTHTRPGFPTWRPSNTDGIHTRPGFPTWRPPNFRARDDWYPSGNRVQHVNSGDDRYPCDHPPLHHQSRCPYPMGATDRPAAYDIPTMGGAIVSPRASDHERIARERKTSRYDIANLASMLPWR